MVDSPARKQFVSGNLFRVPLVQCLPIEFFSPGLQRTGAEVQIAHHLTVGNLQMPTCPEAGARCSAQLPQATFLLELFLLVSPYIVAEGIGGNCQSPPRRSVRLWLPVSRDPELQTGIPQAFAYSKLYSITAIQCSTV